MPIAVIGTNYTIVVDETQENQARKAAEEAKKGGQEDPLEVSTKALVMPGEAVLKALIKALPRPVLDLRAPSDHDLFVLDAVLETAVKEMANAHHVARNAPPPFAVHEGGAIPLWMADAAVMRVAAGDGPSQVPHTEPAAAPASLAAELGVPAPPPPPPTLFTLSRPVSLTVGSSPQPLSVAGGGGNGGGGGGGGGGGAGAEAADEGGPDVDVYNQQLHAMIESALGAGRGTDRALAPFNVSPHHATVVVSRVWGESVVLLRNAPQCHVAVNEKAVNVLTGDELELASRRHLLNLAKRKAAVALSRAVGSSAFAIKQRELIQQKLAEEVNLDAEDAIFAFPHERLSHWVEMEALPVVLRRGDVVQFGHESAVLPVGGALGRVRVAGAPVPGRKVALTYRFDDNAKNGA